MRNHVITSLFLFGSLCALSCQQPNKAQEESQADSTANPAMEQLDKNNQTPLTFERTKVPGQKDTISFDVAHPATVNITLETEAPSSNIRINQLIKPDGQADGPFGKTLMDSLSQTGTYQVVIAESLMAEDPYAGPYKLKIELK